MFFEIEMYKDFIDGLVNLLETVENKDNVTIDLCFNMSEEIEKIDYEKISKEELLGKFYAGVNRIIDLGYENVHTGIVEKDEFYFHADYRRDLNYNYCKKVDYVMWGETDSFFPKEAFDVIETLSEYTKEQNLHRYLLSFQAKSPLPIETMNEINARAKEFDFTYINKPKISGSCLVISSDLIKFGVNVPLCLIYNDDEGLSLMAEKLCGENFIQFICKNVLHVHARRHPQKRCYVLNEDNPYAFINKKMDNFQKFLQISKKNIQNLTNGTDKFYEYDDFKKELQ